MDTAEFWKAFTQQAPGIVGNIVIVILFLRWGVAPFLAYLQSRDSQWLDFYKAQGQQTTEALKGITDTLKELSEKVLENNNLIRKANESITRHDEWERGMLTTKKRK